MSIAFERSFTADGLGSDEVLSLTPEQKKHLSAMTFDEKASNCFWLTVWSKNKKQEADIKDNTEITDGEEVFVERVTELGLFVSKMAQREVSKVEEIAKVDDSNIDDGTPGSTALDSQSTE
ncbi:hypothetical protein PI124_g21185 [Phytophthora idaei]|nr:hypothetical protein PI125_g19444 [Phytophthora idaei]KAG3131833.1 hypothetical protein PI126_g19894 [Phytophthora idaei]KAG3233747.1 hypothetical protein PI124_g21185 [Phytophthora idaei]